MRSSIPHMKRVETYVLSRSLSLGDVIVTGRILTLKKVLTSRGILNPRPGFWTHLDSTFLRPPFLARKTVGCFWNALSVWWTEAEEEEGHTHTETQARWLVGWRRKRKEKETAVNHALSMYSEQK